MVAFYYSLCSSPFKFIIYKNGYTFYLKPKANLSSIELGMILENAEILYGKEAKKIEQKSQIIKV